MDTGFDMMGAFWEDIEQRSKQERHGDMSLQRVMRIDDMNDPHEVTWQIVRSGGEAVMSMRLRRAKSTSSEVLDRPWRNSDRLLGASKWSRLAHGAPQIRLPMTAIPGSMCCA